MVFDIGDIGEGKGNGKEEEGRRGRRKRGEQLALTIKNRSCAPGQ